MNLSDLQKRESLLAAEIAETEVKLAKKRHHHEFIKELIEEEKQRNAQGSFATKLLTRGDFVLTRAAVEARNDLLTFTKKDLEARIHVLYPGVEFSPKSLDRIIQEWRKEHIDVVQEANGITGAIYKNLSPPKALAILEEA